MLARVTVIFRDVCVFQISSQQKHEADDLYVSANDGHNKNWLLFAACVSASNTEVSVLIFRCTLQNQ